MENSQNKKIDMLGHKRHKVIDDNNEILEREDNEKSNNKYLNKSENLSK